MHKRSTGLAWSASKLLLAVCGDATAPAKGQATVSLWRFTGPEALELLCSLGKPPMLSFSSPLACACSFSASGDRLLLAAAGQPAVIYDIQVETLHITHPPWNHRLFWLAPLPPLPSLTAGRACTWCAAAEPHTAPQLNTERACVHGCMPCPPVHCVQLLSHRPSVQLAEGRPELRFDNQAAVAAPKAAQAAWWADGALAVMTLDRQLQLQPLGGACSPLIQAVRPAPGASCLMPVNELTRLMLWIGLMHPHHQQHAAAPLHTRG